MASAAIARQARVLTAVLLTGLGLFLVARDHRGRQPASGNAPAPASAPSPPARAPQEAIYAMFEAARAGNVETYAAQFGGALAPSVRQMIAERGSARFGVYLAEMHKPVKGLAVDAPQPVSDRQARVRIEFVYADRNEAQVVHLERTAGAAMPWKVVRLEKVERSRTVVPYGAPATAATER